MQMPQMDGLAFAIEVEKLKNKFPLFLLTSHGQPKQYAKEISEHFDSYLIKPVKKAQLIRGMLTIFERRKSADKFKSRAVLIDENFAKRIST